MTHNINFENTCDKMKIDSYQSVGLVEYSVNYPSLNSIKHLHLHFETLVIVVCTKGRMRVNLRMENYEIFPNTLLAFHPNSNAVILECQDFSAQCIVFNSQIKREIFVDLQSMAHLHLAIARKPMFPIPESGSRSISKLANLMSVYSTYVADDSFSKIAQIHSVTAVVYQLMGYIAPSAYLKPKCRNEEIFVKFITLCNANYKEHRNTEWYAQELCLTPRYLSRCLFEFSGCTASKWINKMVMQEVCFHLCFSSKSIQQISHAFCFPNQSFFGKYFKCHMGCSPKKYRWSFQ